MMQEFEKTQFLARGVNKVFEAKGKITGEIVCIKEVRINSLAERDRFLRETEILELTKNNPHPNIINYHSHYFEEHQTSQYDVNINSQKTHTIGYIVMEKGITNLNFFLQRRQRDQLLFEPYQVADFFSQMISAFTHLQRIRVAHRDIKPENILLFNQETLQFKVCDVGFGMFSAEEQTQTHTIGGTVPYFSPELYRAYKFHQPQAQYNPFKSDVFSLGLVFLYYASLEPITSQLRDILCKKDEDFKLYINQQIKKIKQLYPKLLGISKILKQMLELNSSLRIDFITLNQWIEENEYLEVKSPARFTNSNWGSISQVKDFVIEVKDQSSICLDYSNLGKTPNEIKQILDNLSTQLKNQKLISFKLKLELNNLNVRQIEPLAKILERSKYLEDLELHLWNNKLGNLGLILLCQKMAKLKDLQSLQLSISNNIITEQGINDSLQMLKQFQKMQKLHLDFGMNQLPIDCCEAFFQFISTMPNLDELNLNLESNQMNLVISKLLKETIRQLPLLKNLSINFSNNQLQDQGLFEIGEVIQNLNYLQLILWNCQIKDKGLVEFSKGLSACKKMKDFQLIMWNNNITDIGCEELGIQLKDMQNLYNFTIDFSNNKIGDKGVRHIAHALDQMHQLREIKLQFDSVNCTSYGLRHVSFFLTNLKNLRKVNLNFRSNLIDLAGVELLFVGFKSAQQIEDISITLDYNKIFDEGVQTLFRGLQKIKGIEKLYLNLESICATGICISTFLDSIRNWAYLTEYTVNFQKNEIDESEQLNCKSRLLALKHQAAITFQLIDKISNK